jgi:hypothetical protein
MVGYRAALQPLYYTTKNQSKTHLHTYGAVTIRIITLSAVFYDCGWRNSAILFLGLKKMEFEM